MVHTNSSEEFELLRRASFESAPWPDSPGEHEYAEDLGRKFNLRRICHSWISVPLLLFHLALSRLRHYRHSLRPRKGRLYRMLVAVPGFLITFWVIFTVVFRPSYNNPPQHYKLLERKCRESQVLGRGNMNNEKVFIAATLYDRNGLLVGGEWGTAVADLVQLLGPDNVHVSVYENDPDIHAQDALEKLGSRLQCNKSLIFEPLPLEEIPHVLLPSGGSRIKRIAFLAEVRNRALRSLRDSPERFDKLLYLNDVMFNPIDAVQLLFSTNIDAYGRTKYGAACAVDFINAFKFYDRFATRDLEGFEMGVPFSPWFTAAGNAASRQDVLAQKDAVRVRACWGGMTAFEARWFQSDEKDLKELPHRDDHDRLDSNIAGLQLSPLHFRYELDPFWDASECCLIHADLTYLRHGPNYANETGIYINPYVRVAYDSKTLGWLPVTRRLEWLYPFVHNIVNILAGLPRKNPRQFEQPGDEVTEMVWEYETNGDQREPGAPTGAYKYRKRTVAPGRFCGARQLLVLKENIEEGGKHFEDIPLPSPPPPPQ